MTWLCRAIPLLLIAAAVCACATETRVIRTSGGLQGLPGAQGGIDAPRPLSRSSEGASTAPTTLGAALGDDELLRLRQPDGSFRLICRNPRELMFHLRKTLQDAERDILLEQVLSERTREAYVAKGMNPTDAVDFLLKHRDEIIRLMRQLPMGEMTPGLYARNIGPSQFRLEVPRGTTDPPLRFRKFDYVFERGGCRLLLIS